MNPQSNPWPLLSGSQHLMSVHHASHDAVLALHQFPHSYMNSAGVSAVESGGAPAAFQHQLHLQQATLSQGLWAHAAPAPAVSAMAATNVAVQCPESTLAAQSNQSNSLQSSSQAQACLQLATAARQASSTDTATAGAQLFSSSQPSTVAYLHQEAVDVNIAAAGFVAAGEEEGNAEDGAAADAGNDDFEPLVSADFGLSRWVLSGLPGLKAACISISIRHRQLDKYYSNDALPQMQLSL
jgi:hypothetical protein